MLVTPSGTSFFSLLPSASKPTGQAVSPSFTLPLSHSTEELISPATQQELLAKQQHLATDHTKGQRKPVETLHLDRSFQHSVTYRHLNIF